MSILDNISRGREDVKFENDTDRRILISGFDPYEGGKTNPSGAVVLALDGTKLNYTDSDGTEKNALVEGVLFPTKYSEFDKGVVENFFDPYLDPAKKKNIFAIITISEDPNKPHKYYVERFASGHRGGGGNPENEQIGTNSLMSWEDFDSSYVDLVISQNLEAYRDDGSIPTKDWNFICTATANKIRALYSYIDFASCPKISKHVDSEMDAKNYLTKLVAWLSKKASGQQQKLLPDAVDNSGNLEFYSTTLKIDDIPHKDVSDSEHTRIRNLYSYFRRGQIIQKDKRRMKKGALKKGAAVEGSGGNFLSNEIYYRVSALGSKYGRTVPNVHLHIPPINPDDPDYATIATKVQSTIRLIVNAQLKPEK